MIDQKANREKLCEALESGNYTQGTDWLCSTKNRLKHCCMGVALEILGVESEDHNGHKSYDGHGRIDVDFTYMKNYYGFTRQQVNELVWRNDGLNGFEKRSFQEISDRIKEMFKEKV